MARGEKEGARCKFYSRWFEGESVVEGPGDRVSTEMVDFTITLQDHNQFPYRDQPYEISSNDGTSVPLGGGVTNADGKLATRLLKSATKVRVTLTAVGVHWDFVLSEIPPVPADATLDAQDPLLVRALQIRLNALGFPVGDPDGVLGSRTREAVALLQGKLLPDPQHEPEDANVDPPALDENDKKLLAMVEAMFDGSGVA